MIEKTLHRLLEGEYLCPVRYKSEYQELLDEVVREEVVAWLEKLDMRLARVGETGAFFMAPNVISPSEITQTKDELRRFRDVYGPAVSMLDLIRQAKSDSITLSPGEYIQLAEIETAVIESASLENHLKAMAGFVKNHNLRNSIRENLKRLLEHLRDDGYVILANSQTEIYQVTGKIEQLYAVIEFIAENESIITNRVEDEISEPDLLRSAEDE